MTRKDYILIAQAIKEINATKAKGERIAQIFADVLKNDNERFNEDKFIDYIKGGK